MIGRTDVAGDHGRQNGNWGPTSRRQTKDLMPTGRKFRNTDNDTQEWTTVGKTPFYLNYGHHPKGTYRHADTKNPHAEDHVQYLVRLQEVARDAINDAQTRTNTVCQQTPN